MITILGAGAYGTAIAHLFASHGHRVKLWCREKELYDSIKKHHVNYMYMPGIVLPNLIEPVLDLQEAVKDAPWIFEAIPVKFMRSVFEKLQGHIKKDQCIILLSKGIENSTLFLPSQIIESIFGEQQKKLVIAGPSFAKEIVNRELTGVVIAGKDIKLRDELISIIQTDYFRLHPSYDEIGVQLAASVKNVIAIGVGILDGLGCGDNTKALFITKAFQEMQHLLHAHHAKNETLYGLAGIGDLILTCIGASSKNLAFGKKIGKGASLASIIVEMGNLPEGFNTIESLKQLIENNKLSMPLTIALYRIINQDIEAKNILDVLRN